jgi:hypothetical protein
MSLKFFYDFETPKPFPHVPISLISVDSCTIGLCTYNAAGTCLTTSTKTDADFTPIDPIVENDYRIDKFNFDSPGITKITCIISNVVGPLQMEGIATITDSGDFVGGTNPLSATAPYLWIAPFISTNQSKPLINIDASKLVLSNQLELRFRGLDHYNVPNLFLSVCSPFGTFGTTPPIVTNDLGQPSTMTATFDTRNSPLDTVVCKLITFSGKHQASSFTLAIPLSNIRQNDIDSERVRVYVSFTSKTTQNRLWLTHLPLNPIIIRPPLPTLPVASYITGLDEDILALNLPAGADYQFQYVNPLLANHYLIGECTRASDSNLKYQILQNTLISDAVLPNIDNVWCKMYSSPFLRDDILTGQDLDQGYSIKLEAMTQYGGEPQILSSHQLLNILRNRLNSDSFMLALTSYEPQQTSDNRFNYNARLSISSGLILFTDVDIYHPDLTVLSGTVQIDTATVMDAQLGTTHGDINVNILPITKGDVGCFDSTSYLPIPCEKGIRINLAQATRQNDSGILPPHVLSWKSHVDLLLKLDKSPPTHYDSIIPLKKEVDFDYDDSIELNFIQYTPHSYKLQSDLHTKISNGVVVTKIKAALSLLNPAEYFSTPLTTSSTPSNDYSFGIYARNPHFGFILSENSAWKIMRSTVGQAGDSIQFGLGTCVDYFTFGADYSSDETISPSPNSLQVTYIAPSPILTTYRVGQFTLTPVAGFNASEFESCFITGTASPMSVTYRIMVSFDPLPVIEITSPSHSIPTSDPLTSQTLPAIFIPLTRQLGDDVPVYPQIKLTNTNSIDVYFELYSSTVRGVKVELVQITSTSPPQHIPVKTLHFSQTQDINHFSFPLTGLPGLPAVYFRISYDYLTSTFSHNSVPFAIFPSCMGPSPDDHLGEWSSLCGIDGTCGSFGCECTVSFEGERCTVPIPDTTERYCNHCQLGNIDECILPARSDQLGTCKCKDTFTGELCDQAKKCIDLSQTACHYPNGQFLTRPDDQCDGICTCNAQWGTSTNGCVNCMLQCNGGRPLKGCENCGCTAGYTARYCQCRSSLATLLLYGFNMNLNTYDDWLLDLKQNQTPIESQKNYNEVMYGYKSLFDDLYEYITSTLDLDSIHFDLKSIVTEKPTRRTKFSLQFTYNCHENNPDVTNTILTHRYESFTQAFSQSDVVRKYFILESGDNVLDGDDLTDTPSTLPPIEDGTGETDEEINSSIGLISIGRFVIAVMVLLAV